MLAIYDRPAIRWLFFLAILLIEVLAITARYEIPPPIYSPAENVNNLSAWLFNFSYAYWRLSLWVISVCLLTLTPYYKTILDEFVMRTQGYRWQVWLVLHILTFAIFATVTSVIFEKPIDPAHLTAPWFSIWLALAGTTLALWLLTLAPSNFWLRIVYQYRTKLLVGIFLGVCAWTQFGIPQFAKQDLWLLLSSLTLQFVYLLLSLIYSNLIYLPDLLIVGTSSFQVEVSYRCSGIEGVLLINVFLAVYLWLFRNDLRFPHVFWLFPLGILFTWLANALRIAMLIAIGNSFSPEIAETGFHANAGWIAFTLISLTAIALSHRMRFFTVNKPGVATVTHSSSLAAALLVPLLVQMATLMITSAFSSGFDFLYPVRISIIAGVLFCYRKIYSQLVWAWSWQAPIIGMMVFIIWMLLEPTDHNSGMALSQGLEKLPSGWTAIWLVFRVFGSVIVVPLVEELAFRGYLIRKLSAKDFENVPSGHFSWLSFLLSSLLFGLLHDRWIAGTLAGMGYAVALYRRGHLGDAIAAHMTTNALIAIIVLTQGSWALWV